MEVAGYGVMGIGVLIGSEKGIALKKVLQMFRYALRKRT